MIRWMLGFCLLFFLHSSSAQAASCCGGGSTLPGVIVGDEFRLFSLSTSASQLSEESLSSGEWSAYPSPRTSQSLHFSFAQLLSDRWQAGGLIRVMHNNQDFSGRKQNSFDLGDLSVFLGYEILPEWEYSVWRPRGFTYLQIVAPTGRSTATAIHRGGAVTGRGFWTIGSGMTLSKELSIWDLAFTTEFHRSLPRTEFQIRRVPDWGSSVSAGFGRSFANLRLFSSVSLFYEGPVTSETSDGAIQRYVTFTMGGSFAVADDLGVTMSYSDQTLLGEPINAPLDKTISLSFAKSWQR